MGGRQGAHEDHQGLGLGVTLGGSDQPHAVPWTTGESCPLEALMQPFNEVRESLVVLWPRAPGLAGLPSS